MKDPVHTFEEIANALSDIADDASAFLPEPGGAIVLLLAKETKVLASALLARESGVPEDALVSAIEAAMKVASDVEMKKELGP